MPDGCSKSFGQNYNSRFTLVERCLCCEELLSRSVKLVHLVANHSRLLALSLHSSCCRGLLCEVRRSHTSHNLLECERELVELTSRYPIHRCTIANGTAPCSCRSFVIRALPLKTSAVSGPGGAAAMGACLGGQAASPADEAAAKRSKELDAKAAADFRKDQETIKLLLLGAGESGKSTIFKQMKILHGVISEEDKRLLTPIVYQNTVSSMKILITQAELRQLEHTIAAQDALARVRNCEESAVIDLQLGAAIKELWADAGIQALWAVQSEFQIVASVKFYFNEIDRISQPGYVATPQDMLYARVRTTGIVTE
eukprot:14501-Heterococcus_DN1.PRE.1